MDEGEEPIRPKEDNSGFDVPTENIRQGIEKGKPTLDKASIKDNINRIRKLREESANQSSSSVAGGGGGGGVENVSGSSNDKRKLLQKFRQQSREDAEDNSSTGGSKSHTANNPRGSQSGSLSARMKLRTSKNLARQSSSSNFRRTDSNRDLLDDPAAEEETQSLLKREEKEGLQQENMEESPIVHTNIPEQDFIIGILPEDNDLNAPKIVNYGPVTVQPRVRSKSDFTSSVSQLLSSLSSLFYSNTVMKVPTREETVRNETEFLKKDFNNDVNRWLFQQKQKTPALIAISEEIIRRQRSSGTHSNELTSADAEASVFALLHDSQDNDSYVENGLYVEDESFLCRQLLKGEMVDESIAELCSSEDIRLSRVTQRLLRELLKSLEGIEVRTKWANENNSLITHKTTTLKTIPELSRIERMGSSAADENASSALPLIPVESFLLRHLDKCPLLRLPENPVDTTETQPMLPPLSVNYGGKLGQWGSDATSNDRLGFMPAAWEKGTKKNIRVIFRLHIHQLVLTDHVMMTEEERVAMELKNSFVQYRNLFEQKLPEYFMYRLSSLIEQLSEEISKAEKVSGSSTNSYDSFDLQRLYNDLIETLPAMRDFSEELKKLTITLYKCWTDLRRIRLQQRATFTPVRVTVRKIRSNLVDASSEGGEEGSWETLKRNLTRVSGFMLQAQHILQSATSAAAENPSLAASTTVLSGTLTAPLGRVSEEIEAQQKKLDRIIAATEDAVTILLRNKGLIPHYVLRLSEDEQLTPDNLLDAASLRRKLFLRNLKIKVYVNIDEKRVTSTEFFSFRPQAPIVDLKKFFDFRLVHQPSDISLDIVCKRVDSFDQSEKYLTSVSIPFPGQQSSRSGYGSQTAMKAKNISAMSGAPPDSSNTGSNAAEGVSRSSYQQPVAHSYSPNTGWFDFSANKPLPSPFTMKDMLNMASCYDENVEISNTFTQGAISCTTEFDVSAVDSAAPQQLSGVKSDDVAVVPPPKSSMDNAAPQSFNSKLNDFTRENDFQSLLPDINDIDVNNPINEILLYLYTKRAVMTDKNVFQLQLSSDFAAIFGSSDGVLFTNYVKFKESMRMRLLKLRCLKPFLFNDPIPLSELAIKSSDLYKKILSAELGSDEGGLNEYDEKFLLLGNREAANTNKITSFLQRVRNSQTSQNRNRRRKKLTTGSVVIETDYFEPAEAEDFNLFLERKRALRPRPKARAPVSIQIDRCDLLVQVIGARNVPLRAIEPGGEGATSNNRRSAALKSGRSSSDREGDNAGSVSETDNLLRRRAGMESYPTMEEKLMDATKLREKRRARSFVEVRFQEHLMATVCIEGGSPLWKQSISIPFRPPQDDFTPPNLEQVRDDVTFTLFDEVFENDSQRGGYLEGESTERIEKRYLASFSVPFLTIYQEGKVEGVFRLDTPPLNFGYENVASILARSDAMAASSAAEDIVSFDEAPPAEVDPSITGTVISSLSYAAKALADCWKKSQQRRRRPNDDFNDGSFIHPDTLNELNYFASDGSSTFIKLLITFDPILMTSPDIDEDLSAPNVIKDDRSIAAYAKSWVKQLRSAGPDTTRRRYSVFGQSSSGLNVFVCRFLTAQQPPPGFDSIRSVIHLVSSIPFMKDAQSFLGEVDLWCTNQQFWEIGAGDEEEHATMLYNYLYYIMSKKKTSTSTSTTVAKNAAFYPTEEFIQNESVFLVQGKAVPEGNTVYVLLRDRNRQTRQTAKSFGPNNFLVINPCTGTVCSAMDPNCPLREIETLSTPYNVWANIQPDARPNKLNFNVLNADMWRPFFGSRYSMPKSGLHTIQNDIEYIETGKGYVIEVEKAVYQAIRNSMRKWRSKRVSSTTIFHPEACTKMQEILVLFEQWKRSGSVSEDNPATGGRRNSAGSVDGNSANKPSSASLDVLQEKMREAMKKMLNTRTVHGCPINFPFTDVEEILQKVKAMCVHEVKHPSVQFILAVRAFPLFNGLVSLWVFLGTLESNA